ncbi:MAG: class I SAM-dependent methyltransferase [Leptospiraceae bacterium]|nr:class I SAM-dependent methyltransferase [Leptospiraceae bacterium]
MSTYMYMKVLEAAPERYDRGMRTLSRGRIDALYERMAQFVARPGRTVLDIGTGTGGVALACARLGARVIAIDVNAGMLSIARARAAELQLQTNVQFREIGMAEVEDYLGPASVDAMTACLVFSEMSPEMQRYALKVIASRLKPGGRLVIADEGLPETLWARWRYRFRRAAALLITFLQTLNWTRPIDVRNLENMCVQQGLGIRIQERLQPNFTLLVLEC